MAVPVSGTIVELQGELRLHPSQGGGLVVGSRSCLRPRVMHALRAAVPGPGPLASDGSSNLIGPIPAGWAALLRLQIDFAEAAVRAVFLGLAEAAGLPASLLRGNVWVQQVELCRDGACWGAAGLVRDLAGRPIPGAHRRSVWEEQSLPGSPLCVSWSAGAAASPALKLYAKREDMLRAEACLRRRKAVLALHRRAGGTRSGLGSWRAGTLRWALTDLAAGAVPLLDGVWDLVAGAAAPIIPDTRALRRALAPLLAAANPPLRLPRKAGRPRSRAGAEAAAAALEAILSDGQCNASGLNTSSPTLIALERMEAAGDLERSGSGSRLFCLAPQHLAAWCQMAAGALG